MHAWPDVLPNGQGVVFTLGSRPLARVDGYSIAVLDLASGEYHSILQGVHAWYLRSGHIAYATREGVVHVAPFDPGHLEVTGPGVPMFEGVAIQEFGAVNVSVSDNGNLLYVQGGASAQERQLVWVTREGNEEEVDPDWHADFMNVSLSPDGSRLAVSVIAAGGSEVWVKDLDQGSRSKLTFEGTVNYRPAWMPDGQDVLFISNRAGQQDVWRRRADGNAPATLMVDHPEAIDEAAVSPDSAWIVLHIGIGSREVVAARLGSDSIPAPLLTEPGNDKYSASVSPDGRWLAYVSDVSGAAQVYVRPFPNVDEARWLVSTDGGVEPVWAHSGRELFFKNNARELVAAEVRTDPTFSVVRRNVLFPTGRDYISGGTHPTYAVSTDDQRFVMIRTVPTTVDALNLVFVQNWFDEVKARVGGGN